MPIFQSRYSKSSDLKIAGGFSMFHAWLSGLRFHHFLRLNQRDVPPTMRASFMASFCGWWF